ncbi:MAG: ATP-binding cassette domain-containing protein [Actinobacteria bacterium]|uniref:Unannotated protein n=1 Tax=freshwater metagenome TaxID=449393 RepID=A0A6J7GU28_9ZZZZ|nr:ATP-binding cassette domain-containing protein [Actinomycetota bacterium]
MSESCDRLPNEPDNSHNGLSVTDFTSPGVKASVRQAVELLPQEKRKLLFLAAGIQISLGLLDLIGIALVGLVAAVAVSGIGLDSAPAWVQNLLSKIGLDDLTVSQLTVVIAVSAVTILILKTILSAVMTRRVIHFLANRQRDVSVRLAQEFLNRPLVEVQRWTTSEAIYALGSGVGAATVSLLGSSITIASEIFLFSIIGITLLVYDPVLTLVAIGFFGIVVAGLGRTLNKWTERNARIITESSINTLTAVSEALSTYREATVLNRRDLYIGRYEGIVGNYATASATSAFIMEIPKYVLEAALYFGVLLLGVVQFLTKDWAAAAATTALFLAAGSRVIPALLRLQGATITIRNAAVQAQPTFFLADYLRGKGMNSSKPASERMTAQRIHEHIANGYPDFDATVVVTDVSMTYSDASEPALVDAHLLVNPGESVALVGSTGAGKSTLADVILGVMEPQSGTVTISGVSPREAINRWPGAIAYVPQAVALVEGTVRENVALGLPRDLIDDELVWDALNRAHLADFLSDSREGLDTKIGERGFRLSGGQRQRLGIARALYTRPKLLVLDEATSALDAETEQSIVQTLDELEGQVTTITVAHRLATVRRADQMLYLEGGRITARGTFDEVRAQVADFDRQAALLGL